jgi:hypothetical protein
MTNVPDLVKSGVVPLNSRELDTHSLYGAGMAVAFGLAIDRCAPDFTSLISR